MVSRLDAELMPVAAAADLVMRSLPESGMGGTYGLIIGLAIRVSGGRGRRRVDTETGQALAGDGMLQGQWPGR